MNCAMVILILLLVMKVIEQRRQLSQLKDHDVPTPHKSILAKHGNRPESIEGSRTWSIPNVSFKRAS
jgi:hypothetical protein